MVFPVRQEFTIAVAACSSVMALSLPTTVAAASASRRARSHRAIACGNAGRAGVNSGGASRTARGSAWNSAKVHFIGPVAIDENSLCQSYHLHRQLSVHAPKRQCNPTYDNHGLQGSICWLSEVDYLE